MSLTSLTFSQIKAQVAAIRKEIPQTRSIAIRSRERWTGETERQDGNETYVIRQCDSPLAMRIALREAGDDVTNVLITNVDDHEIGDDIRVRLKPRKLVPLNSWQIVKSLFQARTIDPRLIQYNWIADTLMELVPTVDFAPVASGFLDAETVWPLLLRNLIGFDVATPDLLSLLNWSTDAGNVARFQAASEPFREAAIEWLVSLAGPTAAAVMKCVGSIERPDALPIGLALGVVFHGQAAGKLAKAEGILQERYLARQALERPLIDNWSAAATEVVRLQISDKRLKQQFLQRSDDILREVGAEAFAWLSDTSPLGFELRLADFGRRLSDVVSTPTITSTVLLDEIRLSLFQHDAQTRERRQLDRVEMALRLVRWLAQGNHSNSPRSLAEAASNHLSEGGYVDWARLALRNGDQIPELSAAYAKLFDRVTVVRESQSRQFAMLLRDWTAAKTTDDTIVPVEQILQQIVAPIAAQTPVLVIVMDGMSVAVFRELMSDVLGYEWVLLAEDGKGLRPGLATVPSVTEVSRNSLLCGRLSQGNAATEATGFEEHPDLLAHCSKGYPPVLFHKALLQEADDASLAADIRREIGLKSRKIVGVVVNAVDDHLSKGEQIDTRWTRDEIKVLPVLLHEAKSARRTVVLIADHGHILECNAKYVQGEGGERWRMDAGEPESVEFRVSGPRVVIPASKSLIAPWSEKIRFVKKKNGYHGGLNPQEMVVPIAVLSTPDAYPRGWGEASVDIPVWWDRQDVASSAAEQPSLQLKPTRKLAGLLFDPEELPQPKPVTSQPVSVLAVPAEPKAVVPLNPVWIAALLASPLFEEQKKLGGRAAPSNEFLVKLLAAVDSRGGKITSPALARAIEYPPLRLRTALAVAQRILNIDGYSVLTRDDASDTIELDRNLLCRQFELVVGDK